MGNVEDPNMLWAWTVRHVERLIEELRYHNVRTTGLAVQVAWKDAEPTGGAASIATPTDRFDDMLDAARTALRRAYVPKSVASPTTHDSPMHRKVHKFGLPRPVLHTLSSTPDNTTALLRCRFSEQFPYGARLNWALMRSLWHGRRSDGVTCSTRRRGTPAGQESTSVLVARRGGPRNRTTLSSVGGGTSCHQGWHGRDKRGIGINDPVRGACTKTVRETIVNHPNRA